MKIFFSFSALLLISFLFSCKKDETPTPTASKADMISASEWVYISGGIDLDKNGTVDGTFPPDFAPECRLDNKISFRKDSTGTTDESSIKCNTGDPQTTSFNWKFINNEASLNITNNVFTVLNGDSKILALSNTSFSLSKDTLYSGTNYTIIVNLKH